MTFRNLILALFVLLLTLLLLYPLAKALAQEHRHPTELITGTTAKFYETWMRPDEPEISCCSRMDCYATPSRRRAGRLQALHRESGDWIDIPTQKIELNRDSPDGMSHLCALSNKMIYCFKEGSGT